MLVIVFCFRENTDDREFWEILQCLYVSRFCHFNTIYEFWIKFIQFLSVWDNEFIDGIDASPFCLWEIFLFDILKGHPINFFAILV